MTNYLLDTNVVSETRKKKPHGGVVSWITNLQSDQIFLCAVTVGELQKGVELTRKQDAQRAAEIEAWIDEIESSSTILAMDGPSFREYARISQHVSDTLDEYALIAASARVHGLTVATRNEKDFAYFPVPVFNPFKYGTS